jgi:hypothetical protein
MELRERRSDLEIESVGGETVRLILEDTKELQGRVLLLGVEGSRHLEI